MFLNGHNLVTNMLTWEANHDELLQPLDAGLKFSNVGENLRLFHNADVKEPWFIVTM